MTTRRLLEYASLGIISLIKRWETTETTDKRQMLCALYSDFETVRTLTEQQQENTNDAN
jgi:hypothetical protein